MTPLDQGSYDVRCEWGERGVAALAPISDAIVIVDVFSFSTSTEIGVARGATIHPYRWKDDTARAYAERLGAELTGARGRTRFSLSPVSFLAATPGVRIVMPSRNGAVLSLMTGDTPTLIGCLRNATAVAAAALRFGPRIAVIPAGERWPDDSLRPALEDWLGAGAILSKLPGKRSAEASAAAAAFEAAAPRVLDAIRACMSGHELLGIGFPQDIEIASEVDASDCVPVLRDEAYTRLG